MNRADHLSSPLLSSPRSRPQSTIQRHRLVYATLAEQLAAGLHALQITAKTPAELLAALEPPATAATTSAAPPPP
jgi:hypothetical protein